MARYITRCAILTLLSVLQCTNVWSEDKLQVYYSAYRNVDTDEWVQISPSSQESESDYITREEDDFTVVDGNAVAEIVLTCRSPRPVYWEMLDVQTTHLKLFSTFPRGIYNENGTDFVLEEFESYLQLYNTPSLSGEYKCRSVPDKDREKTINVFLPGDEPDDNRVFSNPKKEIVVGINGAEETLILPCKVAKKGWKVTLLYSSSNQTKDDQTWTTALLHATFDPKRGFILDLSTPQQEIIGRYKCTAGEKDEHSLIVEVRKEYHEQNTFPVLNLKAGTAGWKTREAGDGVECCSNSTTAPRMFVASCYNKPHCNMVKRAFMQIPDLDQTAKRGHDFVETGGSSSRLPKTSQVCRHTATYLFVTPFLLQCTGDGVSYSGEIVSEFKPPASDTTMKYVATTPTQNYTTSAENSVRMQVFILGNYSYDGDLYRMLKRVDMRKDSIYEGDEIIFDCCALHYHYAIGRIVRVGWENGTLTRLMTPELVENSSSRPYPKDYCFTYLYDASEVEPFVQTADSTMRYFECMVPVWNDVKPVITRVDLKIRAKTLPILVSDEPEVNVTYDQNQVGILRLDCSLRDADPLPKMTWRKDGMKINQTDKHWSLVSDNDPNNVQVHGSRLLFMRAVKAIEGEYICIAENTGGMVERTFLVRVKPRSYVDYWIALAVFGSFFILIICCALRVSTLDKPSLSKVKPELVK